MKKALFTTILIAISAVMIFSSCKKDENPKPIVSNPTFSLQPSTYKEDISVGITCATDGASIHYTTDGSVPNSESTKFTTNISIEETTTVKAIAIKEGYENSSVVEAVYVIEKEDPETERVETPEFIYPAGTYVGSKTIAIKCETEGATIYYTTDGSDPTNNSTEYKVSFKLTESTTVKAIAYKEGMDCSEIAEAHYEITHEKVLTPTFSVAGGTYNEPITNLMMLCETEGATIHFTLNGEEPTESSPTYSEPLSLSETTTVKARAFKNEYEPSDIKETTYVIEITCNGIITVTNSSGTHEFEISTVVKKDDNTLLIKTIDGNDMTLAFVNFGAGTFNFPTSGNDPDATCSGTFVYSNITLRFINGGSITVEENNGIYTLTFTDVSATNGNTLIPVIEQVSLSFTGTIL